MTIAIIWLVHLYLANINIVKIVNKYIFYVIYINIEWMYEIVANKKTNLDVDKFDYLHRDVKSLGISGAGFDFKRIISNSRVINN